MKYVTKLMAGVACAALLSLSPAMAGTVNTTNLVITPSETITLSNITPFTGQGITTGQNVFTTNPAGTIYAWCIDLFHTIQTGTHNYSFNTQPLATDADGHNLSANTIALMTGLMEIGSGIFQGGDLAADNTALGTTGTLNDWAAAIQLAIWDTEYHVNDNADFGTALGWSGGTTQTRDIYNDLLALQIQGTGSIEMFGTSNNQQSFATDGAQISLQAAPVPEPGTLAIFGSALFGLGVVSWYRRRKDGDITGAAA